MKKEGSTKQSVLEAAAKIINADIRELNIPKTRHITQTRKRKTVGSRVVK